MMLGFTTGRGITEDFSKIDLKQERFFRGNRKLNKVSVNVEDDL